MTSLYVFGALQIIVATFSFVNGQNITLETRLGTILGLQTDMMIKRDNYGKLTTFKDVPFGKPPVGELRFQKSQPFGAWQGTLEANKEHGKKACIPGLVIPGPASEPESDDCLHLDIYVPGAPTKAPNYKAVLIWVHNSAYLYGSKLFSTVEWIAKLGDVIVVVPNYRLGVHGTFSTGDDTCPGNFALWDVHLAIRWVHDNIKDYGGDNLRVTIAGVPGNVEIAALQTIYPGNKGLIQRAILMSGGPLGLRVITPDPLKFSIIILNTLGCGPFTRDNFDSTAAMSCLLSKDSYTLALAMESSMADPSLYDVGVFFPPAAFGSRIDGDFIKRHPLESLHDRDSAELDMLQSLDLLTGNVNQEGSMVASLITPDVAEKYNIDASVGLPTSLLCEVIAPFIASQYDNNKNIKDRVCELYSVPDGSGINLLNQSNEIVNAFGDYWAYGGTADLLKVHSLRNFEGNTFQYIWDFPYDVAGFGPPIPYLEGVHHGTDTSFFLLVVSNPWGNKKENVDFAMDIIKVFTNFVNEGDPSTPWEFHWPYFFAYDEEYYVSIKPNMTVGLDLYKERTKFWVEEIPKLVYEANPTTAKPTTTTPKPTTTATTTQRPTTATPTTRRPVITRNTVPGGVTGTNPPVSDPNSGIVYRLPWTVFFIIFGIYKLLL